MSQATFTVVIPTHNRHDLLTNAVQSVFSQTCLPAELIVVDDGSDPPVGEQIFDSAPNEVTCQMLRNDFPRGAAAARNRGVSGASGSWIAFLDDDDVLLPDKLKCVSQAVARNPQAKVLYHPAIISMVRENIFYRSGVHDINQHPDTVNHLFCKPLQLRTLFTL